mgnify:CR=1 FL=1
MFRKILWIVRKELRRIFGDRRLVFTTFILPALSIALLYGLMGTMMQGMFDEREEHIPRVLVAKAPADFEAFASRPLLEEEEAVNWSFTGDVSDGDYVALRNGEIDAIVVFPDAFERLLASDETLPDLALYHNDAEELSVDAANRLKREILPTYRLRLLTDRLGSRPAAEVFTVNAAVEEEERVVVDEVVHRHELDRGDAQFDRLEVLVGDLDLAEHRLHDFRLLHRLAGDTVGERLALREDIGQLVLVPEGGTVDQRVDVRAIGSLGVRKDAQRRGLDIAAMLVHVGQRVGADEIALRRLVGLRRLERRLRQEPGLQWQKVAEDPRQGDHHVDARAAELFEGLESAAAGEFTHYLAAGAPFRTPLCAWTIGAPQQGRVLATLATDSVVKVYSRRRVVNDVSIEVKGGVFVVETVSVIMQVTSFKLTGRRILPKKIARIAIGIEASIALPARNAM